MMSTVAIGDEEGNDDSVTVFVKGAPEKMFPKITKIMKAGG